MSNIPNPVKADDWRMWKGVIAILGTLAAGAMVTMGGIRGVMDSHEREIKDLKYEVHHMNRRQERMEDKLDTLLRRK